MKKPDRRRVTRKIVAKKSNRRSDRRAAGPKLTAAALVLDRQAFLRGVAELTTAYYAAPPVIQAPTGELASPAPNATPFSMLAEAHSRVAALHDRITCLVDTLVGTSPANGEAGSDRPQQSGIMHDITDRADSINRLVTRSHEALDRLNSILP